VIAELNAKSERSYKVDHKNSVHLNGIAAKHDVKHPHNAHQLEEN
jgi:hypothetical protein